MPRSVDTEFHRGSGNIFVDCGFPLEEAVPMLIRADLRIHLRHVVKTRRYSLKQTAKALGVTQKLANEVLRGRNDHYDIDALIAMLTRLGVEVSLLLAVPAPQAR